MLIDKKTNYFKIILYMYRKAFEEKPIYFLCLIMRILFLIIQPFINIFGIQLLIDELLQEKRIFILLGFILFIVLGNSIAAYLICLTNECMKKDEKYLQAFFYRNLNRKAMSINYVDFEKIEIKDMQRDASDGLWYSNCIQGLSDTIINIVSATFTLLGTFVLITSDVPFLAVTLMIVVILNAIIVYKINYIDIKFIKTLPHINRKFSYVFLQLASKRYAKDIRLYAMEDMIMEMGEKTLKEQYMMFVKNGKEKVKWQKKSAILFSVQDIIIYIYLGVETIRKYIGIGRLSSLITSASTFSSSLFTVIDNIQRLKKNIDFILPYIKYMKLPEKEQLIQKSKEIYDIDTIAFKNVSFKYPGTNKLVLRDVSFEINKGEHIAIVGENGAGKSTIMKLIVGLYKPSKGDIFINGINISEIDSGDYLKHIGTAFQDSKLFSFTLMENIVLANTNLKGNVMKICKECNLEELIKKLPRGLQTFINKEYDPNGIEVSGGEMQKILMARLEYRDVDSVYLDEPTAALDSVAEAEVFNRYKKLSRKKMTIFISHRMSSCKLADKIIVLKDGNIVEMGQHRMLMSKKDSIYHEMFMKQAQYY